MNDSSVVEVITKNGYDNFKKSDILKLGIEPKYGYLAAGQATLNDGQAK